MVPLKHVRKAAPYAAAVLLALAGVVAALLANDVRRWQQALRAGDAGFRLAPAIQETWSAHETLPFHLARRLLGVQDDIAFRSAEQLYRSATIGASFDNGVLEAKSRGEAEAVLSELERSDPDRRRAAAAATLLGVLAYADAQAAASNAPTPIERSLGEFQNAVRLDPTNTDAKFDLELVLRLIHEEAVRSGAPASAGGAGPAKGGAGLTPPGSGY